MSSTRKQRYLILLEHLVANGPVVPASTASAPCSLGRPRSHFALSWSMALSILAPMNCGVSGMEPSGCGREGQLEKTNTRSKTSLAIHGRTPKLQQKQHRDAQTASPLRSKHGVTGKWMPQESTREEESWRRGLVGHLTVRLGRLVVGGSQAWWGLIIDGSVLACAC